MPSIINASSSGSGGIVQTADASGVLQLQSNGTTALTVSGSTVTLAGATTLSNTLQVATTIGVGGATPANTGAGITFPATQSASSDANTLDDYEEGTWTPSWTGGLTGVSYGTVRNGYYRKIGSVVHIWFGVMTDGLTVTASGLSLSGLPFTAASGAGSNGTVNVWNVTRWTSSPPIVGQVELSSTLINFYNSIGATGAGTDPVSVTTGNMSTGSGNRNICFGSATYSV